eukprot:scaffold2283_cov104-Isochrysis_galbana.AAC.5
MEMKENRGCDTVHACCAPVCSMCGDVDMWTCGLRTDYMALVSLLSVWVGVLVIVCVLYARARARMVATHDAQAPPARPLSCLSFLVHPKVEWQTATANTHNNMRWGTTCDRAPGDLSSCSA